MTWGSEIEVERRNRIMVSLWAYAYEVMNESLVSDGKYDSTCRAINPRLRTGNEVMDRFFRDEFDPSTGVWIYKHPQIEVIYNAYWKATGKIPSAMQRHKSGELVTQQVSNMGFKSHFEGVCYLAYLGFKVVGGRYCGETVFDYEFDDRFIHMTNPVTKEHKSIMLSELFNRELGGV